MKLLIVFAVLSAFLIGCNPTKRLVKKAPKISSLTEHDYKHAVKVDNVGEEYKYLRKKFPGYKMLQQSLLSYKFKEDTVATMFDALYFQSVDKEVRIQLFNISSFFGKAFEEK